MPFIETADKTTLFTNDWGVGLLNFTVTEEIQQWTLMMALMASPKAMLDCVRVFSKTDFRQDMAAFHVPRLVIHGDADKAVPLDKAGRRAAQLVPGAELKIYGDAPHALYFTEKDRLNQDLLTFIQA